MVSSYKKVLDVTVSFITLGSRVPATLAEIEQALNGSSKMRVLGGFPAYINRAYQIGGRVFHMAGKLWDSLSDEGRWALNRQFLDEGAKEGATFELAPGRWREWTKREIEYLMNEKGYILEEDAHGVQRLVPGSTAQSSASATSQATQTIK